MGRYLAIGLATRIVVSKTEAEKRFGDIEPVMEKLNQLFGDMLSIFHVMETETQIELVIDERIAYEDIDSFVKDLYKICLTGSDLSCAQYIEKEISKCHGWNDIMNIARMKMYENFSLSFDCEYLYYGPRYDQYIRAHVDTVIFALQGKIEVEVERGLFKVFEKLLRDKLSSHPLARALRVYITP